MLRSLKVHNFALLEDAGADFTEGLNVFTGETGAGKSILIDAFSLVLGARTDSSYVRAGTDGLWVQAVFDGTDTRDIRMFLEEQGIEAEDELFIRRQVSAAGRSKAFVNGMPVPLQVLRQLGNLLVAIHGQHENQLLLKPDAPRLLTDARGGRELAEALSGYERLFRLYQETKAQVAKLEENSLRREGLMESLGWEIEEIEAASLKPGEDAELEAESRRLQNSERILKSASAAYRLLNAEKGALSLAASAREQAEYASRYDERLKDLAARLESAWLNLDDCRTELGDYLSSSAFDGARAEKIQKRMDTVYRLKKKYGGSVEAVLDRLSEDRGKYEQLRHLEEALDSARCALVKAEEELSRAAAALTQLRRAAAERLSEEITREIRDLAMPYGKVQLTVKAQEPYTPCGCDDIRLLFSANLGEEAAELAKVASGGELSRLALAVKTVLRSVSASDTVVFDEIDSGVGGVTAEKMAEKLAAISLSSQVLLITHLPQIAAFADNHIFIEKESAAGRTVTRLKRLSAEGRLAELVRMATGSMASEAAFSACRELIEAAEACKKGQKAAAGTSRP